MRSTWLQQVSKPGHAWSNTRACTAWDTRARLKHSTAGLLKWVLLKLLAIVSRSSLRSGGEGCLLILSRFQMQQNIQEHRKNNNNHRNWGIILLTLTMLQVLNFKKTTKLLWSTTSYRTSAGNSELKNYSARTRTKR